MAATLPVPAGLPSPRSPTLSDAGMILPEVNPHRSHSPNPCAERPPSPSSLLYAHSNHSTPKLASAPQGRRGPSPQIRSPPLSAQSSRSTLRSVMAETDAAAKKHRLHEDALASSPTIASPHNAMDVHWETAQQRRLSNTSSLHSEDLENMKWPGFDGPGGFNFDDSGVVLEEDEGDERDPFPISTSGEEVTDQDRWLEAQDEVDDDLYSSAALSRRAEIILANAKKRLNVMEGNLRGARQSLVVSPTFNTMKMASELSHQLSAARERDRTLYSSRSKSYLASPLSTNAGSPGHSRVFSETSVPIPFSPANFSRVNPNKRASSAMGTSSGPWSPEGFGHGRFPVRESRSYEVMRERRGTNDDQDSSLRSYSRGSRSPPNTLETLPEDGDGPKLHRSSSTATDLRVQMNDLKGRISSLKQRAKEDNMRRRSLQSLRTPSPFTSAEVWYAGAEAYKTGGSPIAADAGVGFKTESPVRKALFEDAAEEHQADISTPRLAAVESPTLGATPHAVGDEQDMSEYDEYATSHYEDAEDLLLDNHQPDVDELVQEEEPENLAEGDFVSVDGDEFEPQGESVYEDAVYEMPVTERHEDRVDAFDYEHFFLHSAMGTYSSASRRSSSSSRTSVETTRPPTTLKERPTSTSSLKRLSLHQRNPSVDSVSTVASFATAAEEQDDDEESNEQMEAFSQQVDAYTFPQRHGTSTSMRSDSAINLRNGNNSPSQRTASPYCTSPSGDLANGLQTSKIFSVLLEGNPSSQPRLALNEEEKQLIYSLAAGLQQVCERLQSTAGDQYERKELRRRLDQARRCLSGENVEGEAF